MTRHPSQKAPGSDTLITTSGSAPTDNFVDFRADSFAILTEALDSAAQSETGMRFYNRKAELEAYLPYKMLRQRAILVARQFLQCDLARGDRVAIMASTSPDFVVCFFACQYAGLMPVPLPLSINFGSYDSHIHKLSRLLQNSQARIAIATAADLPCLQQAATALIPGKGSTKFIGTLDSLDKISDPALHDASSDDFNLEPNTASDVAYVQYTSGSTRFPRGAMVTSKAVLNNITSIICHGVGFRIGDRCVSWLPFYHDMGLVGMMLAPLIAHVNTDYIDTRTFAMKPSIWLDLMHRNKATVAFSPPFGYDLCTRRFRGEKAEEIGKYDFSNWRVAGVGAEMIHKEKLLGFANMFASAGFNSKAFMPCYGMAECTLAASFAPLGTGFKIDFVDRTILADRKIAHPVQEDTPNCHEFIKCGFPLPDCEVEIRGHDNEPLPERHLGTIFLRSPSLMCGYLSEPELSVEVLSTDNWLNTGDLGYIADGEIVIAGRSKDIIIISGRNIWLQDIEQIAESFPGFRSRDALAFPVTDKDGNEVPILVMQCRTKNETQRSEIVRKISAAIFRELGVQCHVELVPHNSLPKTSSGKMSRSQAREKFMKRQFDLPSFDQMKKTP